MNLYKFALEIRDGEHEYYRPMFCAAEDFEGAQVIAEREAAAYFTDEFPEEDYYWHSDQTATVKLEYGPDGPLKGLLVGTEDGKVIFPIGDPVDPKDFKEHFAYTGWI